MEPMDVIRVTVEVAFAMHLGLKLVNLTKNAKVHVAHSATVLQCKYVWVTKKMAIIATTTENVTQACATT